MGNTREEASLEKAVQSSVIEIDPDEVLRRLESDAATDRALALQGVFRLVTEDPEQAERFTDPVIELLDDDVFAVKMSAALAAMPIVKSRPGEMLPAVSTLVEFLDSDPPLLRFRAAGVLAPLTASHPQAFADHTGLLVETLLHGPTFDTDLQSVAQSDALTSEQKEQQLSLLRNRKDELERSKVRSEGTREVIINILVETARTEPDSCEPHHSDLVSALSDDSVAVRAGAVEVVRHVAAAHPETVGSVAEPLIDRLNDDAEHVRARAVRALGLLEVTEASDPLSTLAESESSDELADLASETAEWLASDTDGSEQ